MQYQDRSAIHDDLTAYGRFVRLAAIAWVTLSAALSTVAVFTPAPWLVASTGASVFLAAAAFLALVVYVLTRSFKAGSVVEAVVTGLIGVWVTFLGLGAVLAAVVVVFAAP